MGDAVKKKKKTSGRKSPWRFLFAACAAYGVAKLLGPLWRNLMYLGVQIWDKFSPQNVAVSIGIIGGADGPTAIFLTTPPWVQYLLPLVLLTVGIWGLLHLSRCKET